MGRFFFGGVLVIVGGVLLFLWWQENETLRRLENDGVTTEGRVVEHYTYEDCSTDDNGHETCTTKYRLQYRFRARNEQIYERWADVPLSVYRQIYLEAPIAIRYLPSDPDVSRLADEPEAANIAQWGLLGGGAALASGLLALLRRSRR